MPPITGTVKVAAPVTPANTASPYPSHFAEWGHGGYRAVATIADRDAIIPARRGEGMVVFVKEDKTDYTLEDGIENSNWVVKNYPGSSTGGDGGGDGGDGGNTGGDVTNNITNKDIKNYFYYDGCVPGNFSKLDALIRNVADGNPDALYRDKDGNIVISAVDQSYFTFNTTSKSWINDFHYISGTLDTIAQNGGNVILTITDPDSEEIIINVNDEIAADDAVSNGFINDLKWSGYISFSKPGIYTISANQLNEQGEKSDTITQTVNIVEKEFTIEHDGLIDTPQDLIERLTPLTEQTYNFAMLPGSSFIVSLVRVNVTDTGIDRKRYATVSGTQKLIDADNTSYVLPETLWDETIEDGLYSLLITGKDGGTKIPYYFYGPFSVHINDALHDGVSDNYTNDEYDVPFAPPPPINEEESYVLPPVTPSTETDTEAQPEPDVTPEPDTTPEPEPENP